MGGEAQADHVQVEVGVQQAQRRRLQEEDFRVYVIKTHIHNTDR